MHSNINRKEITNFLGNLLEKEKFNGIGKYWAKEVSIDANSINCKRIDYMQFIPKDQCSISSIEKGIFVCYEIKSCIEDVYSGNGLNFLGEKNYIVTTAECYNRFKEDVKNKKFSKYLQENYPESSLYFGVMVLVPKFRNVKEELNNPTPLDSNVNWSLAVVNSCREGLRKRSMTELLFCMLRSK